MPTIPWARNMGAILRRKLKMISILVDRSGRIRGLLQSANAGKILRVFK